MIGSGCLYHMIGDVNKFLNIDKYDGSIVRFSDNTPCLIKGRCLITLYCKNDTNDVLFVDGLKHKSLSIG